jgi:hypothetical protein
MEIIEIINRLSILSNIYHALQQEITNKYQFNELRDVRISIFKHCYIVIDSTYAFFLVRNQNMNNEVWWNMFHV